MRFKKGRRAAAVAVIAASSALAGGVAYATSPESGTTASSQAVVKVAYSKKLKRRILVNAEGMTLYLWTLDSGGKPTCYDDAAYHCSQAWPPLRSTDPPAGGKGVTASWLTTVPRTDGDSQVSYRGHPLSTDAGSAANGLKRDRKPGDVNGQGFYNWYVVSPAGKAIRKIPHP
jgi:predicted lipoprotein with Yx(FWY)xxD motif